MNLEHLAQYNHVRRGGIGFYQSKRGLIEVSGGEAVRFLNGLITNDVGKLESHQWMSAAFPNAQGRLLAAVRVLRFDEKFLFETEAETHAKVFQNLHRFTYAGDFKVEDLSERYACFAVRGHDLSRLEYKIPIENEIVGAEFAGLSGFLTKPFRAAGSDIFVSTAAREDFASALKNCGAAEIGETAREVLRIENGVPLYGVDVDETTIVPETGIADLISYQKGCYIGQEIIARIHFRGHIAKQLTGLILESEAATGDELKSLDGKNAGKITSVTFSPTLEKHLALAYVRYDYLAENTALKIGETTATVKNLPFIE